MYVLRDVHGDRLHGYVATAKRARLLRRHLHRRERGVLLERTAKAEPNDDQTVGDAGSRSSLSRSQHAYEPVHCTLTRLMHVKAAKDWARNVIMVEEFAILSARISVMSISVYGRRYRRT